jgi:hypothetical protein
MLLITVPHGKQNEGMQFDAGAIEFVPYLESALRAHNVQYLLHIGGTHRELVDLNRKEAYGTQYYTEFCGLLKNSTVHLDLHSFPFVPEDAPEEDALTSLGDDLRAWSVHTAVFLDTAGVTNQKLLNEVTSKIEKRFDIGIFDSTIDGYLTLVSNILFEVPSLVMEVNDQSVEEFEALAIEIAASFADYA